MAAPKYDVLIQATFIGSKPSMGFFPGHRYTGWVRGYEFISTQGPRCPYSVSGFLTFWSDITVVRRNQEETIKKIT